MTQRALARAKVNLTLHVTGRRADGYRLLDSLVVFPEIGDEVRVKAAQTLSLSIEGQFANLLESEPDNLVLQAARLLGPGRGAAIGLKKNLPVASGIGGGSADAAAALRGLSRLWDIPLAVIDALTLGADVPVCQASHTSRMQGIGDVLTPVDGLPAFWIVLVNRGVAVPTSEIFNRLDSEDNPKMPGRIPDFGSIAQMADWLAGQRNDLQGAAILTEPGIADVLTALGSQNGCLLARMSGSGGTCFGIFNNVLDSVSCVDTLQRAQPNWWAMAAPVRAGLRDARHDEFR